MRRAALAVSLVLCAGPALAIEFRLPDGTKVTGARVDHIEGNLAVVEYDGGVTTVPVADLPAALRPKRMTPQSIRPATPTTIPGPALPPRTPNRTVYDSRAAQSASPAAPARGAVRSDVVFDPLRGVVPVPPPTPPPSTGDARRAVPDTSGRVVVTAEAVPYVDRFAEDEDNPTYKRYQENLLLQKKKRDAKEAPKDILDLPIFRYSPMRDPNKSAYQSPVTRPEDNFNVPNYMKPSSYIDDPYTEKK
jgi:hypothetical protein